MTRQQAYSLVVSVYRGEITLASLQIGTIIRLIAYCIHQEEAALDDEATRQFADNAEAELNSRFSI